MKRFVARALVNAFTAVAWCCIMPLVMFSVCLEWVFAWYEAEA